MKTIFYLTFCIITKNEAFGNNLVYDQSRDAWRSSQPFSIPTFQDVLRILSGVWSGSCQGCCSSRTLVHLGSSLRSWCSGSERLHSLMMAPPSVAVGMVLFRWWCLVSSNTRRKNQPKELHPGSLRPENLELSSARRTSGIDGVLDSESRLRLVGHPALRRVLVFTNFWHFRMMEKRLRDVGSR